MLFYFSYSATKGIRQWPQYGHRMFFTSESILTSLYWYSFSKVPPFSLLLNRRYKFSHFCRSIPISFSHPRSRRPISDRRIIEIARANCWKMKFSMKNVSKARSGFHVFRGDTTVSTFRDARFLPAGRCRNVKHGKIVSGKQRRVHVTNLWIPRDSMSEAYARKRFWRNKGHRFLIAAGFL